MKISEKNKGKTFIDESSDKEYITETVMALSKLMNKPIVREGIKKDPIRLNDT